MIQDRESIMKELLKLFVENNGIVHWIDLPEEFWLVMDDAYRKDLIKSFCETESYHITEKGRREALREEG